MKLGSAVLALLVACSPGAATAAPPAASGTVLKPSEIKSGPFRDAKTTGALARGDSVQLLSRRGGWYRVRHPGGEGWVRMLSIRRGEPRAPRVDADELHALASGRAGTGRVVATTGIRGLDEQQLKASRFDEAEVASLESLTLSPDVARRFAAAAGLKPRAVGHLPAPD